ncbi:hypothetical protein AB0861_010100, partial [Acinetobacter baumannii]
SLITRIVGFYFLVLSFILRSPYTIMLSWL